MCSICLGHSYNLKNKPKNNNNRLKDNSWTMVYHGYLTTKITQIKITENGKVEKRHECWWISWIRIDVARCTDTSLFHHDKLFRKGPCLNRRNIWKKRKKKLAVKIHRSPFSAHNSSIFSNKSLHQANIFTAKNNGKYSIVPFILKFYLKIELCSTHFSFRRFSLLCVSAHSLLLQNPPVIKNRMQHEAAITWFFNWI